MANYSRALEVTQYIKEVTPGTLIGATKVAPNMKILLNLAGPENNIIVASGNLYPVASTSGIYWVEGSYEIIPTYDEIHLIFDSLLKAVTATGAGAAKTRVWTPAVAALDTIATYSFEHGQTGKVLFANYGVLNSWEWEVSKEEVGSMTGEILARYSTYGAALTAVTTTIASSPIPSTAWNAYSATTFANLAAAPSQQTGFWKVAFSYGPVRTSAAFINSSQPSWDALGVGEAPDTAVTVTVPEDVTGSDFAGQFTLAKKQAGTPIYLRLKATGADVEVGIPQTLTIDMCVQIVGFPEKTEVGPFVGLSWPCRLFRDVTAGKAIEITNISATA